MYPLRRGTLNSTSGATKSAAGPRVDRHMSCCCIHCTVEGSVNVAADRPTRRPPRFGSTRGGGGGFLGGTEALCHPPPPIQPPKQLQTPLGHTLAGGIPRVVGGASPVWWEGQPPPLTLGHQWVSTLHPRGPNPTNPSVGSGTQVLYKRARNALGAVGGWGCRGNPNLPLTGAAACGAQHPGGVREDNDGVLWRQLMPSSTQDQNLPLW